MDKKKLLKSKVSSQMLNMMQTPSEPEATKEPEQIIEEKIAEKPINKASEEKKASESNKRVEKVEIIDNTNSKIDSEKPNKKLVEEEKVTLKEIINDEPTPEKNQNTISTSETIETKEEETNVEEIISETNVVPEPISEIKKEKIEEAIGNTQTEEELETPVNYEIETDENDVEIFSVRLVGRSDYMQFILSTKKITKAEYIRQLVDADMKKNMPEFSRYMTMAKQYKEFLKTFGK